MECDPRVSEFFVSVYRVKSEGTLGMFSLLFWSFSKTFNFIHLVTDLRWVSMSMCDVYVRDVDEVEGVGGVNPNHFGVPPERRVSVGCTVSRYTKSTPDRSTGVYPPRYPGP